MAAFAIKAPLFPFHTWLPLVHTEAPTAGSVVLAGVIIKMGAYGFVRFSFELFPQASVDLAPIMLVLAVIGIIYGAIVAAMQTDLKRDHRVLVGRAHGLRGARHLLAHGHRHRRRGVHDGVAPAHHRRAVPRVGMLYERRHTRELVGVPRHLEGHAGARRVVPHRAVRRHRPARLLRASSASSSSLLGAFVCDRPYAIVATFGVILAAVYSLWAFQRAFTGKPTGENAKMKDVIAARGRSWSCRCSALSLFLGLYPKPVLDRIEPAVEARGRTTSSARATTASPKPPAIAKEIRRSSATSRRHGRGHDEEGEK